jgi:hypothetical protein
VEYAAAPLEFASPAVAVGQEEQPLALVRRAHVARSEQIPLDIRPAFGKVGKNSVEPKRKVPGDVLAEQVAGSTLAPDSEHVGPQVAFVEFACALACEAERLAWISRNDEIHRATPSSSVEGS